MDKIILKLAAFLVIITANAINAKDFFLTNNTPFKAHITATWTACPANYFAVNPGERFKIDGKDCLLTALRADIHQSGPVNLPQQTNTSTTSSAKIVTATPYTSLGQSDITEFQLVGPNADDAYHIAILSTKNDASITKEKPNEDK